MKTLLDAKTNIKKTLQTIEFLKLSTDETEILISSEKCTDSKAMAKIFEDGTQNEKMTVASFVRLAIYNPEITQWCNKNWAETWQDALSEFGTEVKYEFKPQKKLSNFELLAGAILVNQSTNYKITSKQHIFILYAAMNSFSSIYAALLLARDIIITLKAKHIEQSILPMIAHLDRIALIHGSPGYFIYSHFYFGLFDYFLNSKEITRASGALQLGIQFLLTADLLKTHSEAELSNAVYGNKQAFSEVLKSEYQYSISKDISFAPIFTFFKQKYPTFVEPIEVVARTEAQRLAKNWTSSTSFKY